MYINKSVKCWKMVIHSILIIIIIEIKLENALNFKRQCHF